MGVIVSSPDGRAAFSRIASDGGMNVIDGMDSGKHARERRRSGFVSGPIGHTRGGIIGGGENQLPMLPPLPAHLLIGSGGRRSSSVGAEKSASASASAAPLGKGTFGLPADFILFRKRGRNNFDSNDNDNDSDADTDDDELSRRVDAVSHFRRHFRFYDPAQRAHELWAEDRSDLAARSKAVDELHRRRSEQWHRRELRGEMRRAGVLGGADDDEDDSSSGDDEDDEDQNHADAGADDVADDGTDDASGHVRLTASSLRAAASGSGTVSVTASTTGTGTGTVIAGTDGIQSARRSLARLVARSLKHTRLRCAFIVWSDAYALQRESKVWRRPVSQVRRGESEIQFKSYRSSQSMENIVVIVKIVHCNFCQSKTATRHEAERCFLSIVAHVVNTHVLFFDAELP
jgi:hypothetical protein